MGKKSKRKSNNTPSPCYHGCTKKEFNNRGKHYRILEDWSQIYLTDTETCKNVNKFYEQNKRVMDDPTFSCFVIAHVTEDFLEGKDDDLLHIRLLLLLLMRYEVIPRHEGKDVDSPESKITTNYNKYKRDILTERGRINCMAREIPCDCMEEKRIAAKSMEKNAMCFGCRKDFSKNFDAKDVITFSIAPTNAASKTGLTTKSGAN